jgi:hypothetical protein
VFGSGSDGGRNREADKSKAEFEVGVETLGIPTALSTISDPGAIATPGPDATVPM